MVIIRVENFEWVKNKQSTIYERLQKPEEWLWMWKKTRALDWWVGGWMDGWVDGWMDGGESQVKDCLQQLKIVDSSNKFNSVFERIN